jgi:hypothetical protein
VRLLGSAWNTDIGFDNVRVLSGGNEKTDSEIKGWNAGLPPFMGESPKKMLAGRFAFTGS